MISEMLLKSPLGLSEGYGAIFDRYPIDQEIRDYIQQEFGDAGSRGALSNANLDQIAQQFNLSEDYVNRMREGLLDIKTETENMMLGIDNAFRGSVEEGLRLSGRGLGDKSADFLQEMGVSGDGDQVLGAAEIKLNLARGDLSADALNRLFNGDQADARTVAINFKSATGTESARISRFLTQGAKGEEYMNQGTFNTMENALRDPEANMKRLSNVSSKIQELPGNIQKSVKFNIEDENLTGGKIEKFKAMVEDLPASTQKNLKIEVDGDTDMGELEKKVKAFDNLPPKLQKVVDINDPNNSAKQINEFAKEWESLDEEGQKDFGEN